jgi:hypothetical protein
MLYPSYHLFKKSFPEVFADHTISLTSYAYQGYSVIGITSFGDLSIIKKILFLIKKCQVLSNRVPVIASPFEQKPPIAPAC